MRDVFGRVMLLLALAGALWILDRATAGMGLVAEPLTYRHALGLACAMVLLMWVARGKVSE